MKIEYAVKNGFKLGEDGFWREPRTDGKWQKWHFSICCVCHKKYITLVPKISRRCSKLCLKGTNKGPNNAHWKDGRSYKTIRSPEGNRVLFHRYIMEKHIGRKLKTKEIVHHINHNHRDNRIENLEIMTQSKHAVLHLKGKKRGKYKTHTVAPLV